MMKMKKYLAAFMVLVLGLTMLAGCRSNNNNNQAQTDRTSVEDGDRNNDGLLDEFDDMDDGDERDSADTEGENINENTVSGDGSVYYLNFKPEVAEIWEEIADKYQAETGVSVKVQTAASGTYEQTLKSEIAKKDAPTLFQINGPIGYQAWKDYTADLSDTNLYDMLLEKDMAITEGDGVYGIPYVVEGYGIIYNDEIMRRYFDLEDKAVDIDSAEDINNFDTFKAVVEDMSEKKEELGIEGVFASTSFSQGEEWRWHTHLANIPVYYEYQDQSVSDLAEVDFTYHENFKNIFDLYLNNSVTESKLVGSKSVEDSMAEFALGRVAMVQNGNWGWGQINDVSGNTVAAADVKFLPVYTGMEGEETQGLAIGTENYLAVNKNAAPEDQAASIAFVEWLFSSETGKEYVTNHLGFVAPFDTFEADERPEDPLAQELIRYMEDEEKNSVSWNFTSFPSQSFKDAFGADLLAYAQGQADWEEVVENMRSEWAAEKAATAE